MAKLKNSKTKNTFKGFTAWQIATNIAKCEQVINDISSIENMKLSSEKSYDNYILVLIVGQLREKFKKINLRAFDFGEVRNIKFTELEQQIALMLGLITEQEDIKFNAAILNKMREITR